MMARVPRLLANAAVARPSLTVAAIFLGAVLTTLQGRLFSAALPDLRGQFGLDVLEAAWLGTALNGAQLLTMPVVPWLALTIGPARVLCIPSLVLGAATLAIPFCAHHYPALVALHLLAGLCLGVYLPLTVSLALRSVRPGLWLLVMAAYSLRVSTGMDAGMGVSAWFVEELDWRWIYWTAAGVGPLIALLVWKAVPMAPVDQDGLSRTDWGGMALFCGGLGLIFLGVEPAERLGWMDSGLVASSLAGGLILFGAAVLRAARHPSLFGALAPLGNRNIRICLAIACLFGVLMTPTSLLIPAFLGLMGGLKPMQTGTAALIAFAAYLACTPLAVYLGRRIEPRLLIMAGLIVIALVARMGAQLSHDWRVEQFVGILILQSVGECIMLIGLIAAFVTNLNPVHAVALGAYVPVARVLTPVLAGTVMTAWLRIAGDLSRASLDLHVQAGSPLAIERAGAGLAQLAQVLARESQVIAYIDGFNLVFWTSLTALLLAMGLRSSPPNPIVPPFAAPVS